MSLEGWDVPGDTWQVLVPVLWGFTALDEPHPMGWIPASLRIPWHPMPQGRWMETPFQARGMGFPSTFPGAPEAAPSIPTNFQPKVTQEGHLCRDPAPRNLWEQARHQMAKQLWVPSSNSPLF